MDWDAIRDDAAKTLSRYVQFDTTNPPGNEKPAAEWLAEQLAARGITRDVTVYETAPGRGLLLARIAGRERLKPLLINHHIDVVPADPAQWTYPPFSGAIADGFVWGRGTLDTKSLGIVFLLALELLVKEGAVFRRPILFTAVPDEETGGEHGMRWLVENRLEALDPEWVWDEGSGGVRGVLGEGVLFGVAVAEKHAQPLRLVAEGEPGHGSMPHNNNANVILLQALQRVLARPRPLRLDMVTAAMFRAIAERQPFPLSVLLRHIDNPLVLRLAGRRLSSNRLLNAMLRDTISLTMLHGGYRVNVIPERAEATIDCRLLPETEAEEFVAWVRQRIADERVKLEVVEGAPPSGVAPLEGPFMEAARRAVAEHVPGAAVFPLLVTGGTDGRYFRQRGYAAYGFGPTLLDASDISRVHGIDERISLDNLVLGVKIVRDMLRDLTVVG